MIVLESPIWLGLVKSLSVVIVSGLIGFKDAIKGVSKNMLTKAEEMKEYLNSSKSIKFLKS